MKSYWIDEIYSKIKVRAMGMDIYYSHKWAGERYLKIFEAVEQLMDLLKENSEIDCYTCEQSPQRAQFRVMYSQGNKNTTVLVTYNQQLSFERYIGYE